jgi:hypothetical protein
MSIRCHQAQNGVSLLYLHPSLVQRFPQFCYISACFQGFPLTSSCPERASAHPLRLDMETLTREYQRRMRVSGSAGFCLHFCGPARASIHRLCQESHCRFDLARARLRPSCAGFLVCLCISETCRCFWLPHFLEVARGSAESMAKCRPLPPTPCVLL